MQTALCKPVDKETILFTNHMTATVSVTITANKYKILFDGDGDLNRSCLESILECQALLEAECQYHPIKSGVLNVPKPEEVWMGQYDEEEKSLCFGGERYQPQFKIHGDGRLERLHFESKVSLVDDDYAWRLTRHIVLSFGVR